MQPKRIHPSKKLRAYLIGVALGDGNLSNPNGRATRLRITCDTKYPRLIKKIRRRIEILLPQNKVFIIQRTRTYLDIASYSNYWETILGWRAKGGSKFIQKVSVPEWIKQEEKYAIECIQGLIETDGCIYHDRGYEMVMFNSIIPNLANDFFTMIRQLGFKPKIYAIKPRSPNAHLIYNIRLSRNVDSFLELVHPEKY